MQRDRSKKSRNVIQNAIGRSIYPNTVYEAARRHNLDWIELTRKAGVRNSNVESRPRRWDSQSIIACIQKLHTAGHALNAAEMTCNKTDEKTAIITAASGVSSNSRGLYKRAVKAFGSWSKALVAAGLDPKEIEIVRWYRDSLPNTRRRLLATIRALHDEGLPLNHKSIRKEPSAKQMEIISKYYLSSTSGKTLYRRTCVVFGSWRNGLRRAGLSEKLADFYAPSKAKSRYGHLPIHFERTELGDSLRQVGLLGFAPKTPEEMSSAKELIDRLLLRINGLERKSQKIALQSISVLLENSDIDELDTAIEFAARSSPCKEEFAREAKIIFAALTSEL